MANTIALKLGDGAAIRKERVAAAAVTPGMLVEPTASDEVQGHSIAAGVSRKTFAVENDLVGGGIDDDYAIGETVQYLTFQPGEELQALLADSENVAIGTPLVSAGNGGLQAAPSGAADATIVAFALEALNNTSGALARIEVEVA